MISKFLKSRLVLYGLLLLISGLYWCFDSVWSYVSYERNLNALLFMVPSSFLDTFSLRVAPYQIASRLGVVFLLMFSGTLLIELSNRKQKMANALVESEERYEYLLEHANVGSCILQDMIIHIPNLKLLEITEYSEEEFQSFSFMKIIHPDDKELILEWHKQAVAGINPVTDTLFRIITKKQEVKWLQVNITLITWKGEPAQFAVLHDFTKRKLREEKHQQTKKMELIGMLAGGVAHDLNNILSGIVSYPELLLQLLPDDSPLCSHVETMHEAGLRASAVVADLLTVARGVASTRNVVDLNTLVEKFMTTPECQVLRERYPEVTCVSHLHQDMVPVLCSEIHIQKTIMNLLFNAFEAIETESGTVTVSTDWKALNQEEAAAIHLKERAYVVLSVSDTGTGIIEEHREHIFEPFYTRKVMGRSGTGLGLTVVWNTIVDHDGGIDIITSEKGTRFDLYLPLARLSQSGRESLNISDNSPVKKGAGERILIVDDEAQQREIGCQFLKFLNYSPEFVASGEEAITFLRQEKVDLVILDMVMEPGMNGRETYEQILKLYPDQRALIVSGYAGHDEIARALKLGVGGFIKKPYSLRQLAGAVAAELQQGDNNHV